MVIPLHPISRSVSERLVTAGLHPGEVAEIVRRAISEDLADGDDVTTRSTVPMDQRGTAEFVARQPGTLAGIDVALAAMDMTCGPDSSNEVLVVDSTRVRPGEVLARVEGPIAGLLVAERTALNLLCHLSGVATATAAWADALESTGARVRDTRKTTPGLRVLEKYAVRCGGGVNHRMGLYDAALVKDNHVIAAGGVAEAFARVRASAPGVPVEIEVDDLDQLREAMAAGADVVLLDNMSPALMREAVSIARQHEASGGGAVVLEASGGLTLETAAEVGSTGVHFVAVGAITHSAPVLDIGFDLRTEL